MFRTQRRKIFGRSMRSGFTILEMMVAVSVGGAVIAAGVSSLNMLARSSVGLGNYSDMNRQSRIALEVFSSDIRMAYDVTTSENATLAFSAYDVGGTSVAVTYVYDSGAGTLTRNYGGVTRVLMTEIFSFDFNYYYLEGVSTTSPIDVKEVEIFAVLNKRALAVENTNEIVSSRYMMRNRQVNS